MLNELFETILKNHDTKEIELSQYSPQVLAYLGDSVFEVFVRTLLVAEGNSRVSKLHKRSIDFVRAKAQSDIIHTIMVQLTPEEQDVVRRGRNAKPGNVPKNADIIEYKYATGFECLLGYLYLKKDFVRLMDVLKMAVSDR